MRSLWPALIALLVLSPAWSAAGDEVKNFTLQDTEGRKHSLYDHKNDKAVVLFFIGTDCPLANRYLHRVFDLHRRYADKGVTFLAVNPNAYDEVEDIRKHARDNKIPFPVLLDRKQSVADSLNIKFTPTAIVIDPKWDVRYRGSVDDNKQGDLVKNSWLQKAIASVLAGKKVEDPETKTFGCLITREKKEQKDAEITYAGHVAKILNERCVNCHRSGQVAPFSFGNYREAKRWASNIKLYTQKRLMPPWMPSNHGMFKQERWMPQEEIDQIAKWVDAGAPLGDPEQLPDPPKFASGWTFGEPDLVIDAEGGYVLGAEGDDEYRCYVLPTDLPEDKWVTAVEVRPGNYNVIHHIIAYVDTSKAARRLDKKDPKPGYRSNGTGPLIIPSGEMSGYAPGTFPYRLPEGVGRFLPKGSDIVLETHYHKNGRRETDNGTKIGLYFSDKPIRKRLDWHEMINFRFRIPAGDGHHVVKAQKIIRKDIHAISIMPHMHLLGKKAKIWAKFPDKTTKTLIDIPKWDFNWQDIYQFKKPLALPKGTRLYLEMVYDNSKDNPNNPNDPPRDVTWGEQTTDEMCIAFISYTRDDEDLTKEDD